MQAHFCLVLGLLLLFQQNNFYEKLSAEALALTRQHVVYDPTYFVIPYPNGDVPEGKGVCTDVVIRAYRKVGIDLQKEVHEDMLTHFSQYPQRWGMKKPDKNIDHRRVPNLMTFFSLHQGKVNVTESPADYHPGDIVTWDLGKGVGHIGVVVDKYSDDKLRPLIVHNIGNGQELSDCLFKYTITGHYRYKQ